MAGDLWYHGSPLAPVMTPFDRHITGGQCALAQHLRHENSTLY